MFLIYSKQHYMQIIILIFWSNFTHRIMKWNKKLNNYLSKKQASLNKKCAINNKPLTYNSRSTGKKKQLQLCKINLFNYRIVLLWWLTPMIQKVWSNWRYNYNSVRKNYKIGLSIQKNRQKMHFFYQKDFLRCIHLRIAYKKISLILNNWSNYFNLIMNNFFNNYRVLRNS